MAKDSSNTRNLPFHAGMAVGFGLPYEEALRAITYYPAQILGLEKELGSLAKGKIADVVVTDGDLLESTTEVTPQLVVAAMLVLGRDRRRIRLGVVAGNAEVADPGREERLLEPVRRRQKVVGKPRGLVDEEVVDDE